MKRWLPIVFGIALLALAATAVLLLRDPWPGIADEDALVEACGAWLDACNDARAKGEPIPPAPPEIDRLRRPDTNDGQTRAYDGQVTIFVRTRKEGPFGNRYARFTNYFYVVYPPEKGNSTEDTQIAGDPAPRPRIFRVSKSYKLAEDISTGYVLVESTEEPLHP
jgi:hypothetical protein